MIPMAVPTARLTLRQQLDFEHIEDVVDPCHDDNLIEGTDDQSANTKGDNYVHEVILDLNKVFITPIEREDILALSMSMDDVLDGLEHTAAIGTLGINWASPFAVSRFSVLPSAPISR